MKLLRQASVAALICVLALGALLPVESAQAGLNISQVPLIVSTGVPPNLMLLLDDTGSMRRETMPNELSEQFGSSDDDLVLWMFPPVEGLYGNDPYENYRTVRFEGELAERFRSSEHNRLYYDPAVTYRPWVNEDNATMPDADPEEAPHNLVADHGTRDLTADTTETVEWWNDDGTFAEESVSYYPATYFDEREGWIEIRDGASYGGEVRQNRTDCVNAPTCTYDEEIRNFANWYTYHRSRIFVARSGMGRAFAAQGSNIRVGLGLVSSPTDPVVLDPLRFGDDNRAAFFDALYETPLVEARKDLRRALYFVGKFYSDDSDAGPWSETPGESGGELPACRMSHTALLTDGFWDGDGPEQGHVGNADGNEGDLIVGPDGQEFRYEPVGPFRDEHTRTLADVAMLYWKNDLVDLDNRVPTSPDNPAFWQHMVTFTIGLGVEGTIDPDQAFNAIARGDDIPWPDPREGTDASRVDDLLHAAVNSRGGFYSAADPDGLTEGFTDTFEQIDRRTSSSASVAANSTRLETGTRIYQGRFNSERWSGELLAFQVQPDGSIGDPEWDAGALLPGPLGRNIVTVDPDTNDGHEFLWGELTAAQQQALSAGGGDELGQDRLAWLRGDRDQELANGGLLRNRDSRLGDIVNSNPEFMGITDFGFAVLGRQDGEEIGEGEGDRYRLFVNDLRMSDRPGVVFVGANDGMLHAFDSDSGEELFAFVSNEAFIDRGDEGYGSLAELTDPDYRHRYYMDGSPRILDAYLDGVWHTVLVGSTGAGGRSVFALDVTDPENFGPGNALWEFSADDDPELGATISEPTISRLPDGRWVALFGNGYNSESHRARLFVVDLRNGELLERIDTGAGADEDGERNGLSTVIPIDVTGDRSADLVYAGDLQGNVWRFETDNWNVTRLFTAEGRDGDPQPITSRLAVGAHPEGGLMLWFGTGQFFEEGDNQVGDSPQVQSFYGLRDRSGDVGGGGAGGGGTLSRGDLQEQTIVLEGRAGADAAFDFRVMSAETVDDNQEGWFLDLVSPLDGRQGERVINEALLRNDRVIFVTNIPTEDPCGFGGSSWLMELDAINGTRTDHAVFDINDDGRIDAGDIMSLEDGTEGHAGGQRIDDMATLPYVVETGGGTEFKYINGASGEITAIEEASSAAELGRQSWEQLR